MKFTPATVLFGRNLESECAFLIKVDDDDVQHEDYVRELMTIQSVLIQLSKNRLDEAASDRESNTVTTKFNVNDWVLLTFPNNPPRKLSSKYRGPFRVVKVDRPDLITVINIVSGKEITVHVDRLVPFVGGDNHSLEYLTHVAATDETEFVIERILDHRMLKKSSKKKKVSHKDYQFLVSWLGYDDTENTWEPYNNLKDTIQLQNYIAIHPELNLD